MEFWFNVLPTATRPRGLNADLTLKDGEGETFGLCYVNKSSMFTASCLLLRCIEIKWLHNLTCPKTSSFTEKNRSISHSVMSFSLIHMRLEWNSVSIASTSPRDHGLKRNCITYYNLHCSASTDQTGIWTLAPPIIKTGQTNVNSCSVHTGSNAHVFVIDFTLTFSFFHHFGQLLWSMFASSKLKTL